MRPSAMSSPDAANHEAASDNVGSALLMSDARTLPGTLYLMSILTVAMVGTAAAVDQHPDFQGKPPLPAKKSGTKLLALPTDNIASVKKKRLNQLLAVRFDPPGQEVTGPTYLF